MVHTFPRHVNPSLTTQKPASHQCEEISPLAGSKWALIWMQIAPKQGLSN
jgi:hypothetical protein